MTHQDINVENNRYTQETGLVEDFLSIVTKNSPWDISDIALEFYYGYGKTDIIASSIHGETLAFEAKLEKWRIALQQAYRNTSFATRSYVLLPPTQANRVAGHAQEFIKRNVGLCSLTNKRIVILIESPHSNPVNSWLSYEAEEFIRAQSGKISVKSRANSTPSMC